MANLKKKKNNSGLITNHSHIYIVHPEALERKISLPESLHFVGVNANQSFNGNFI